MPTRRTPQNLQNAFNKKGISGVLSHKPKRGAMPRSRSGYAKGGTIKKKK